MRVYDLDGDVAGMLAVPGQEHGRHAAAAEDLPRFITIGQCVGEAVVRFCEQRGEVLGGTELEERGLALEFGCDCLEFRFACRITR
jgi:hypothetical protein